MNLNGLPVGVTEWSQISQSVLAGTSGTAIVRLQQLGDIQLRLVTYSQDYVADHWCNKGHIVFVIAGQLVIEHQGGAAYTLMPSTSYHVADNNAAPHRVLSKDGATVFVVD